MKGAFTVAATALIIIAGVGLWRTESEAEPSDNAVLPAASEASALQATPQATVEPMRPPTPKPTNKPTPIPVPIRTLPPIPTPIGLLSFLGSDDDGNGCHDSYEGACLDPDAYDYDCFGGGGNGPYYTGPVRVDGFDDFELDRNGDGWGCE